MGFSFCRSIKRNNILNWQLATTDKKFAPFFWTQFWGAFNDNYFKNALVVLVAFRGVQLLGLDSASIVALAGGLFILPFFLFSPLAGQFSDKYEKSKIIRATKLLEIFIMFFAALGFLFQSYLILLGLLFLMGTQSTFFGPVKYSIIPELIKPSQLTESNALIELGTFLSILLGTIAGGLVTALPGADYYIAFGLLFFSVVGYVASLGVPIVHAGDPHLKVKWNPGPEYISLIKIIGEKKALFNSVLAISWFWFFGAGILSVLPVYVKDYLYGNENVVTLFLAMFTLGVGLGSVLCEKISYQRAEIGVVPIGSLGLTVFILDLYFVGSSWLGDQTLGSVNVSIFLSQFSGWRLLFDFFMMSVFGGIFIVPLYTLLQERARPESRSRVIAAANIMNAIFMVIASIVVMIFYKMRLSPVEIFAIFGLMNIVVSIYIYSVVPEFTLRFYSWVLARLIYSIKVDGLKHIPKDKAFVLVANHVSYVDWLILSGVSPRPLSFVMYYKFFEIPFIRHLMKQAKVIPMASAKENQQILDQAFIKISQELKLDNVICIFPEGKLTSDGQLSPFRPGLLKILENDPVVVVPVVIHGLWQSIFSRALRKDKIHRRKIKIEFLTPIQAKDIDLKKLEILFLSQLGPNLSS